MTTNNINFNVKNGLNVGGNASIGGTLTAVAIVGNVATSSKWTSPITLNTIGDVTTSVSFDGSTGITMYTTLISSGVTAGTYNQITVNAKGLTTSGLSTGGVYSEPSGVLRTSEVNLTNNGYLPLSTSTLSYTYYAATYPALGALCGVIPGTYSVTQQTISASTTWAGVTNNGTVFCAVAGHNVSSNVAAISPDGINWTATTLPISAPWYGVAWGGNIFCAIVNNSTAAATSPDGVNWTLRTMPSYSNWSGIVWNNSMFIVTATGGSLYTTSSDGITWTMRTLPAAYALYGIGVCGSTIVASAQGSSLGLMSPDGISWTIITFPNITPYGQWCYSFASNGSIFCGINSSSSIAITSSDGISWTQITLPTSTVWGPTAWNGSYFLCNVIGGNTAITSPDGITWTTRTLTSSPSPGNFWYISGMVSKFCAIGQGSNLVNIIPMANTFITPTYTGTLGIANATWFVKT